MSNGVLVVIGTGGMGVAGARRLGPGKSVLLADHNEAALTDVARALGEEGQQVTDVSSKDSVIALARAAAELGPVRQVFHTAGVSPTQASVEKVLHVDLLGVALVLDAFAEVIAPGGAGVVVSSMSGYMTRGLTPEIEGQLARTPADQLLSLPSAAPESFVPAGLAYAYSKRANQLRVRAASTLWGGKGARVNSISPGVISTAMGQLELASPSGAAMRAMVDGSGTGRLGSPDDIAAAAEFLFSDAASFITGVDLLVDGGVVGALTTGQIDMSALRG